MFDIGWPEFVVLLVVALLVLGPKDLPKALYQVGKWVKAARKVTREFQRHVDDMVRESELEDVKKGVQAARGFSVKKQVENLVDPDGDLDRDDGRGTAPSRYRPAQQQTKPAADPAKTASTTAGTATDAADASTTATENQPGPAGDASITPRDASTPAKDDASGADKAPSNAA